MTSVHENDGQTPAGSSKDTCFSSPKQSMGAEGGERQTSNSYRVAEEAGTLGEVITWEVRKDVPETLKNTPKVGPKSLRTYVLTATSSRSSAPTQDQESRLLRRPFFGQSGPGNRAREASRKYTKDAQKFKF